MNEPLSKSEAARHRALAATANDIAADCAEAAFVVEEKSRE